MTESRLPGPMDWRLPATTTHDGLPLGNGLFGALLWGQDQTLRITINRADFWDHRGGVDFGPEATYANIRRWLEAGDEATLRRVFEGRGSAQPGQPARPTRLPMGRLDLTLPDAVRLTSARLNLGTGQASLVCSGPTPTIVEALVPRGRPVLVLRFSGYGAAHVRLSSRPPDAPEVLAYYRDYGFPPAQITDESEQGGWTQELPADPALCVAWRRVAAPDGSVEVHLCAEYGDTPDLARLKALGQMDWAAAQGFDEISDGEAYWWRDYWRDAASIALPDSQLQELYYLGMYKLPGISWPGTPAATLQGPWVEEYRMPPWSADYHFNINVQECYWPAYGGNQLQALEPLWELLHRWLPKLRANASLFLGLPDGLMLNHAVDDRCTCMGGFWTGSIDHGATAWVAHMLWQYYRYTLDVAFLEETAYPFMLGAMQVYEAMLEAQPDGSLALPVSVSPEYEGAAMWAWGRNASFQLAIIHWLCGALSEAARILGRDAERIAHWDEIARRTPRGAYQGEGEARELILWEGQPLAHSHRHHSHLAGLYPFDVFDPWGSAEDRALMDASLRTWTRMGQGEWTGWCMPWAAILWARMGQGERARQLLREFRRTFMTQGRASTHDAVSPGLTVFDRRPDVMQIEASMAAANAVLEMLAHTAAGVLAVFPAVPRDWDDVRFEGIRAEGALLVSAERRDGATCWVRIRAEAPSRVRLRCPFSGPARVRSSHADGDTLWDGRSVLDQALAQGEELYLSPA